MLMRFIAAGVCTLALSGAAAAQDNRPSQYRSLVFLGAIADRGLACGLLRPWQAAALNVQAADVMHRWTPEQRTQLQSDAAAQGEAMACDDESMNVWIGGAQRGFEGEMLAHFIVIYAALSEMAPPVAPFTDATQLQSHDEARAAIAAKLAELEASGAVPEGGGPWPDFIARTSAAVTQTVRAYEAGELPERYTREQIETLIAGSVRVTELWLADSGTD